MRECVCVLTLCDGDGLETVQFPQQARALGGMEAEDKVSRSLRRAQRVHGLIARVRAQVRDGHERAERESRP